MPFIACSHSCRGKVRNKSRADAERRIQWLVANKGYQKCDAYLCMECLGYHIGRP